MCEKSHDGGAAAPPPRPSVPRSPVAGGAVPPRPPPRGARLPKLPPRWGEPPTRPPDKLRKPSTLVLKKSVHTKRLEVAPPCECPTNQKALMLFLPASSMMDVTMFWRYSS